jgi:Fe-S-cluster containining protein
MPRWYGPAVKRSKKASRAAPTEGVRFDIKVGGESVSLGVDVPSKPTSARRMLPVFQSLTHQVIDVAVAEATKRGESVSCKAGCGACCRQLVPISLTEARAIAALVAALPEPRRTKVRVRFARAVARLEDAGMLEAIRTCDESNARYFQLGIRYFQLGIPCPFLEDESCSIHPQRPIICREYLVTSAPEHCAAPPFGAVRRIPIHAVSANVARLEYRGPTASRVALVLALEWADEHRREEPGPRPPVEWIEQAVGGGTDPS